MVSQLLPNAPLKATINPDSSSHLSQIQPYIISRHLSGAGRKKIRGGAVVLAKADRIFLIFWYFFIKEKVHREKQQRWRLSDRCCKARMLSKKGNI